MLFFLRKNKQELFNEVSADRIGRKRRQGGRRKRTEAPEGQKQEVFDRKARFKSGSWLKLLKTLVVTGVFSFNTEDK